jgi:hypothetical protein
MSKNPYAGQTVLDSAWTAGYEGGKMKACDQGSPYWKAYIEGMAAKSHFCFAVQPFLDQKQTKTQNLGVNDMTSWIDNVAGARDRFSFKAFERSANLNAARLALTKLGAATPTEMGHIFEDLILMAKCGADAEFAQRLQAFWYDEFVLPVQIAADERQQLPEFRESSQLTAAERRGEA